MLIKPFETEECVPFFTSLLTHTPQLRAMLIPGAELIKPTGVQKEVVTKWAADHPTLEYVSFASKHVWVKEGDAWTRVSTKGWIAEDFEQ